jgi:branched-chain amino acid transport system substrate-binding protein
MLAKALNLEILNPDNPVAWQTGDQDFSAQVTKLKSLNPDGITLGAIGAEAARLGKEMKRQGVTAKAIGGVPIFSQVLTTEGGDAVEGWFTAGTFWLDNPDPKVQDWVKKIRERHKVQFPNNPDPILDSATWYDSAIITLDIMKKAGITGDTPLDEARAKIRDGWSSLKDYQGISGKTSIDAEGEGVKEVYVMEVKGGKFARVP